MEPSQGGSSYCDDGTPAVPRIQRPRQYRNATSSGSKSCDLYFLPILLCSKPLVFYRVGCGYCRSWASLIEDTLRYHWNLPNRGNGAGIPPIFVRRVGSQSGPALRDATDRRKGRPSDETSSNLRRSCKVPHVVRRRRTTDSRRRKNVRSMHEPVTTFFPKVPLSSTSWARGGIIVPPWL